MALVTAVIIDQHLYFAMNAPAGADRRHPGDGGRLRQRPRPGRPARHRRRSSSGPPTAVGEESIISRTGGAPTLAFGMSQVLSAVFGGAGLTAFWYHFAIMFEALFILTTVDAGTRVARFMLSDSLGNFGGPLRKFRDPSWRVGAWICSLVVVVLWGAILLMGVTDPLGGINTLFPLFGIANQLLAAIALTVVTVVVVKKKLYKWAWIPARPAGVGPDRDDDRVLPEDLLQRAAHRVLGAAPGVPGRARPPARRPFGVATSPEAMDAVIRNTSIQGTLSIIFAVLVLIVVAVGVVVCVRSVRAGGLPTTEEPDEPSRIFAPRGMIPTAAEREVQALWDARERERATTGAGS